MVRKVSILMVCFALALALGNRAQAATHTVYDGNMSSTYIDYFRDIVSGIGFNDNYVAFRSGQYEYTMIVGEIEYDGSTYRLSDVGTCYTFYTDSSYGSFNRYSSSSIELFELEVGNAVIYADQGNYPRLTSRGDNYEILQTYTLCVALLFALVVRIFGKR